MPRNAELMARNARLDGLAFRWPYNGHENHQIRYYRIIEMLCKEGGFAEADVRNYIKYTRIPSGKGGGKELTALFIGGLMASAMPASYVMENIAALTEVQMKVYFVDAYEGAHNDLAEAVFTAPGGKFNDGHYGGKGKRGRNEPGHRGTTFGADSSDCHVTTNRYRGCRTHLEAHVKGQMFRRIVANEADRAEREYHRNAPGPAFREIQYQAALRGAERYLSAIRSRRIVLTDFFQGVSYVSWLNPLHEKGFDLLDTAEERQSAATGGKYEFSEEPPTQEELPI